MRCLLFLTLLMCALRSAVAQASVEGPPECGVRCTEASAANSSCAPADIACLCADRDLEREIQTCALSTCSVRDQLATQRYSYELCGVDGQDRTTMIWTIAVSFGLLALGAFVLRCIARLSIVGRRSWGPDDWVMTLVMGFAMPLAFISIPLSKRGLGLDVWFVEHDDITHILYLWYFDAVLYVTSLSLTKISILLFYLTVFPKPSFRLWAHALIVANVAYAIVFGCLLAFQCRPIAGAWLAWDEEYEATCISLNVIGWSGAAANIALDVATLALPMPELFALSMSRQKKVQIIGMFALGFIDTIVAIIRLQSIITFGTSRNITQDFVEIGYMSTIEVPVGIVCACLPAIRSLFGAAFPRVFGSTSHGSTKRSTGGGGGGGDGGGGGLLSSSSRLSRKQRASNLVNNKISVRQEWTVLSDPAPGSDSEVELVGVAVSGGAPAAGDGYRGVAGGGVTGASINAVVVESAARPQTPWDGTIGNGTRRALEHSTHPYRSSHLDRSRYLEWAVVIGESLD
ncbi:hypothetical protein DL764_005804 [Monosporascus ibericus]|uniref:CFEM domain-containing protein n=1 Tax=Monosporascus ibericus TaxID=155417 RepID=A0A4Q4T7G5_9PEZI|nr:hypothetical protein DL764_005804 [Monosporascus ibericus]